VVVNLKDNLLLAEDANGLSAWDIAIYRGKKEILKKLWGWGREVQVNLKNDLLLAVDANGLPVWDIPAYRGKK
jgi:hypothetical protein